MILVSVSVHVKTLDKENGYDLVAHVKLSKDYLDIFLVKLTHNILALIRDPGGHGLQWPFSSTKP